MPQAIMERRSQAQIELREKKSDDSLPTIVGYAAVFDKQTKIGGRWWSYNEVIKRGAFTRTLKEGADVRALIDHDPSKIIGRSKAGSLRMVEDTHGLHVEIEPSNTQTSRDLVENIRNGNITGMSFGFQIVTDNWRMVDGEELREIFDVDLFDVSPVTFPAYDQTEVSVRSALGNEVIDQLELIERALWKSKRGKDLTDEEVAAGKALLERFTRCGNKTAPAAETEQKSEVDQLDIHQRDLAKLRLQLAGAE